MNLIVVFGLGYGVEFIYKQLMSLLLLGGLYAVPAFSRVYDSREGVRTCILSLSLSRLRPSSTESVSCSTVFCLR